MGQLDVVVVGAGLIGSAAARHCAREGASVLLVGPDEPADLTRHQEVFSSHYDAGRITRTLDRSFVWAELARRSIQRYGTLEEESGITFHERRGFLRVDPPGSPAPGEVAAVEARIGIPYQRLSAELLRSRLPDFEFPDGYSGMLERGDAGIINPRRLILAQHRAFEQLGGRIVRGVVQEVLRGPEGFEIVVPGGTFRARRLLVATGAYAGLIQLTPDPVPLRLEVETVWLARVSEREAERLNAAPSLPGLWYEFDWHPTISHIYLLPPLRYPDGKWYLKIGANVDPDIPLGSVEEVGSFFRRGGTAWRAEDLRQILHRLLPDLDLDEGHAKPCVLCYTGHGRPFIHRYADGTVVAAGGNGASAKSSDEIGRLAARRVLGLRDDPELPGAMFEVPL